MGIHNTMPRSLSVQFHRCTGIGSYSRVLRPTRHIIRSFWRQFYGSGDPINQQSHRTEER